VLLPGGKLIKERDDDDVSECMDVDVSHKLWLIRSKGISLVAIDCNKPLTEQGPFDVLLHKVSGLFLSSCHKCDSVVGWVR
jgi:hypothetical protein